MSLCDVVDKLHDEYGLSYAGAAKEADATGKTIDEPLASDHRSLYIDLRLWLNR